jgi:hypothetical protein
MSLSLETVYVPNYEISRDVAYKHISGMSRLGGGLYSNVYSSHDTPFAIKVMSGCDAGYLAYIQTISQLETDNPHVPKVFRYILYRYQNNFYNIGAIPGKTRKDTYVFFMEKLKQPARYNNRPVERFAGLLRNLLNDARCGREIDWKSLRPQHRDLITILELAREAAKQEYYDLHSGNIMVRENHFVVTDPLG